MGNKTESKKSQPSFKLEWEPLKNDARNLMVSSGTEATAGRLQIVVPVLYVRTRRVANEIQEVINEHGDIFLRGGGWSSDSIKGSHQMAS